MDLTTALQKSTQLKAQLDALRPLKPEVEKQVLQKLHLDWNYNSNHLEGNSLDYGETKALLLFGITAQGKPLKDHLETSGHDEAVLWIEEQVKGKEPLTETFIRQLHELILREPYFKKALSPSGLETQRKINIGTYKTTPNHVKTVTGEMFYFASPEETPAKMQELLDWYRAEEAKDETERLHPIVLAAEFHYRFIIIHPFDDGNGRMARLLMNFILLKHGFPPAIVRTEDKNNYFAALRQADAGLLAPFVSYIAQSLIASLEIMLKAAQGLPFEEADDVDKAIALLENKLKNLERKIEKIKSFETLKIWGEEQLPLVLSAYLSKMNKLNSFYAEVQVKSLQPSADKKEIHRIHDPKHLIQSLQESFWQGVQILEKKPFFELFFSVYYRYQAFNRGNIEHFDYESSLKLNFEQTSYRISCKHSNSSLSKLYHETPSDEELDLLLGQEVKAHIAFIEQQLSEQQKNIKNKT
jgi:Fic family protein